MSLGARFKSSLDRVMTTLHGAHLAALFSSVVGNCAVGLTGAVVGRYNVWHSEISK